MINFTAGDTITLTGLTDVTGVTLSQYAEYGGTATWDETSVVYNILTRTLVTTRRRRGSGAVYGELNRRRDGDRR